MNRNIIQNIVQVFIFTGILHLFSGCKKLVEIDAPQNELSSSAVFSDSTTATSAMNGLYSVMYNYNYIKSTPFQDYLTTLPALSADELYFFPNALYNQYLNNKIAVTDNINLEMWSDPYNFIYQANSIMEGVQASPALSTTLKKQLTGEALTIRALCYFYLVNYYGKVPLVLNTKVVESSQLPRTDSPTVYNQIIDDLVKAKSLLQHDYSYSAGDRTRINYYAATALLARTYLYREQWQKAEQEASILIDDAGIYMLSPLNDVFLANSEEAILQFYTNRLSHPAITLLFFPSDFSGAPNFVVTTNLLNAFEPSDNRKDNWIGITSYNGNNYSYPLKYKTNTAAAGSAEFDMVFRLAEQYLIRAEARARQDNLGDAKDDLDEIRNRAGLGGTTANDKQSIINAIQHERQVEFCFEYGHRWLDLKRTSTINAVMNAVKPGKWASTAALFPIPQNARNTNSKLDQNAGY